MGVCIMKGGLLEVLILGMRHKFVHVVKLCVCMLTTTSVLVIILGRAETNMKFWVWIVWMEKRVNIQTVWATIKHLEIHKNLFHVITEIPFKYVVN